MNQKKSEAFLNQNKSIFYLFFVCLGVFLRVSDFPLGNSAFLFGSGMFYGHLCYRSVVYKQRKIIHVLMVPLTTAILSIIILTKYNVVPATLVLLLFTTISVAIDSIQRRVKNRKQAPEAEL